MAKQTSKYFASVISRLLESRRSESIEVDQNFKQQLREGLMARAELVGTSGNGGVKGFLTKWRYVFALVPSVLLLTIVAAHMMSLPVEIDSDVVVPMASKSESLQNGGEFADDVTVYDVDSGKASVFDDVSVSEAEIDFLESSKKIKTFPGSTVMPEKYLIIDLKEGEESVSPVKIVMSGGSSSSSGVSPQVNENEVLENDDIYYRPQGAYRYELIEDIFVDTGVNYERDSVESHKEIKSSDGDGLNGEGSDNGPGLSVGNGGSQNQGLQQSGGGSPALVPYFGSENLYLNQDLGDVNVVDDLSGVNNYNISYYVNLTETERVNLESRIASFTGGGNVNSVVVSEIDGVIKVEVYYVDGSNLIKTFSRQAADNGVYEVKIVNTKTVQQTRGLQYRSFNIHYAANCSSGNFCVVQ